MEFTTAKKKKKTTDIMHISLASFFLCKHRSTKSVSFAQIHSVKLELWSLFRLKSLSKSQLLVHFFTFRSLKYRFRRILFDLGREMNSICSRKILINSALDCSSRSSLILEQAWRLHRYCSWTLMAVWPTSSFGFCSLYWNWWFRKLPIVKWRIEIKQKLGRRL